MVPAVTVPAPSLNRFLPTSGTSKSPWQDPPSRQSRTAASGSCRTTGRTPTTNGCATSRTGASAVRSGGDTAYPPGMTMPEMSTWDARKRRCAGNTNCRTTMRCARTRMCSTPGSAPRSGPFPRWDGPRDRTPEGFLPTSVLVTGFDIIFFWVARMIMMGQVQGWPGALSPGLRARSGARQPWRQNVQIQRHVLDPIDLIDGIELEALRQAHQRHDAATTLPKRLKADPQRVPTTVSRLYTD